MRSAYVVLGFFALAVVAFSAASAAASSTTVTQPNNTVHAVSPQTLQLQCPADTGSRIQVNVPSIGSFAAQSVSLETASAMGASSADLGEGKNLGSSRQHGSIKITKEIGAASPQLFEAQAHNTLLPTVTITMRKAGGSPADYAVWTLSNATVTGGQRQGPSETLVFNYQTITVKQCSGAGAGK